MSKDDDFAKRLSRRRHRTYRDKQVNIKATDETIDELNDIADTLRQPLGAVLELALRALREKMVAAQ